SSCASYIPLVTPRAACVLRRVTVAIDGRSPETRYSNEASVERTCGAAIATPFFARFVNVWYPSLKTPLSSRGTAGSRRLGSKNVRTRFCVASLHVSPHAASTILLAALLHQTTKGASVRLPSSSPWRFYGSGAYPEPSPAITW